MSVPVPTHDSWWASLLRRMSPGMGWCGRCGKPWDRVEHHATPYSRNIETGELLVEGPGRSCFPLCESCWSEIGIAERVRYYESLVGCWTLDALRDGRYDPEGMNRDLDAILEAVRAGL